MIRSRTRRLIARRAASLAVAGILLVACGAAAQDDGTTYGVVVQVEQTSTTRHVMAQEGAEAAADAGVDTQMLSMLFGQMADMVGMGAAALPGEFSAMIPPGFMNKLQIGGQFAAYKIGSELNDARTPESTSSGYTIYIEPDLFMLQSAGFNMIWQPARAGRDATMWYTDPSTGQLTPLPKTLTEVDAAVGDQAQHSGADLTPLAGSTPRELLGYTAYGYRYSYTMDLDMGGFGVGASNQGMPGSVQNVVEGEAWIAPDVPDADKITAFYRNFAASFGNQGGMMGGQTGVMASLTELGVPLETSETIRTYLISSLPGHDAERTLVVEGTSTSVVTDIQSRKIEDEELFGPGGLPPVLAGGSAAAGASSGADPQLGAPASTQDPDSKAFQVEKPCDCSCDAFEALKTMDDDDPDALGKAVCARKCMAKWVGCAKK